MVQDYLKLIQECHGQVFCELTAIEGRCGKNPNLPRGPHILSNKVTARSAIHNGLGTLNRP